MACVHYLVIWRCSFLGRSADEWRGGLFTGQREASLLWGGRRSPQRAVHSARSHPRPPPRRFCLQVTWACWLALPVPRAPSHCPPSRLSSIGAEPAVGPGLGHCPPPPCPTPPRQHDCPLRLTLSHYFQQLPCSLGPRVALQTHGLCLMCPEHRDSLARVPVWLLSQACPQTYVSRVFDFVQAAASSALVGRAHGPWFLGAPW